MDDGYLVREYLESRSQEAFRQLVERYEDLVLSLATRQLGGNVSAAEDVAQQVFVLLAKKAHWLAGRQSLGGWLHRATLNLSHKQYTKESRRMKREQSYASQQSIDTADPAPELRDALKHLDAVLQKLPEQEREAIILRYYRGMSLREVGQSLGSTEEAARKRVSRAMDKLGDLLRKKGVVLPVTTALAAVLASSARVTAAGVGFASSATQAAAAAGAFAPAGAIATVVQKAALMTKMQAVVLCAAAAAVPLTVQWSRIRSLQEQNNGLRENARQLETRNTDLAARAVAVTQAAVQESTLPTVPGVPDATPPRRGNDSRAPHFFHGMREEFESIDKNLRTDSRLLHLASRLGLEENQLAQIRAAWDAAPSERDALRRSLAENSLPAKNNPGFAEIQQRRNQAIQSALTPEQWAGYQQFEAEERQSRAERMAGSQLSDIQKMFPLTEEQKNAAYALCFQQAELFDSESLSEQGIEMREMMDKLREQQKEILTQVLDGGQLELFSASQLKKAEVFEKMDRRRSEQPDKQPPPSPSTQHQPPAAPQSPPAPTAVQPPRSQPAGQPNGGTR